MDDYDDTGAIMAGRTADPATIVTQRTGWSHGSAVVATRRAGAANARTADFNDRPPPR